MSAEKSIFRELVLTPEQLETNRWVMRLDQAAIEYEARWGIGRLPTLVSIELQERWQRQQDRLAVAIRANDIENLPALVDGTIRGWKALQDAALAAGHKAIDPDSWEVSIEGITYRITRTLMDARGQDEVWKGTGRVLTLSELVRVYHHAHATAYAKNASNGSQDVPWKKEYFENGGDPLPFEMKTLPPAPDGV